MSCGTTAAEAAREIEVAAIARRPCSGGDVIMKACVCGSLIVGLLMCAVSVFAQQGTSEIRGRLADAQGGALPGVSITVRNQDTGMFRETVSNPDGTYFVSGILPGVYELTAELQAFRKYQRKDVRPRSARRRRLTSNLRRLDRGGRLGHLRVADRRHHVEEVGGTVTARELVELPSVNRNFVGFVGLLPGIIPSISTESFGSDSITVNGQDPRNNNYMLDGANNNDDVIGQRAGTQARTPIEAVAEFQVITNQFDAEFGRTAGAIINAVTKQDRTSSAAAVSCSGRTRA